MLDVTPSPFIFFWVQVVENMAAMAVVPKLTEGVMQRIDEIVS